MLFAGDRNHGCRFLEATIHGTRAVFLENDQVRILVLLDKGADIAEFLHKPTDTDCMWRSPLGLGSLHPRRFAWRDDQVLTDRYYGGWFEAFPNVGPACQFRGSRMPQYGEICHLAWDLSVVKDEPTEVVLKTATRTVKTPFLVEKIFTLRSGSGTLQLDETIRNLGREALPYQWGHHPNLGGRILEGGCRLEIPARTVRVRSLSPESRFVDGTEGTWPVLPDRAGRPVDLRIAHPPGVPVNEILELNDLERGHTRVSNPRLGLAFELEWDASVMPHTVAWHVNGLDSGYPRYGDTQVLGFVPRSDRTWGLEASAAAGDCVVLEPGAVRTFRMAATIRACRPDETKEPIP